MQPACVLLWHKKIWKRTTRILARALAGFFKIFLFYIEANRPDPPVATPPTAMIYSAICRLLGLVDDGEDDEDRRARTPTESDLQFHTQRIDALVLDLLGETLRLPVDIVRQRYEIFNPCVVYDSRAENFIAAFRIFYEETGKTNRKSWAGVSFTLLTRLSSSLDRVTGPSTFFGSMRPDVKWTMPTPFLTLRRSTARPTLVARAIPSAAAAVVDTGHAAGSTGSSTSAFHDQGAEDVRLLLVAGDRAASGEESRDPSLFLIGTEGNAHGRKRVVLFATVDIRTFARTDVWAPQLSLQPAPFNKNWMVLHDATRDKYTILHYLQPLTYIDVEGPLTATKRDDVSGFEGVSDDLLAHIVRQFKELASYHLEFRLRCSPVQIESNLWLSVGGMFIEWNEKDSVINEWLVPSIASGASQYSEDDARYWQSYRKLYLSFFFTLSRDARDAWRIESVSSFFQFPSGESANELVVFVMGITIDAASNVVVSYGVGDNRAYVCRVPLTLVQLMMQSTADAVFLQNLNISEDELFHVTRSARAALGYAMQPDSYATGDVWLR